MKKINLILLYVSICGALAAQVFPEKIVNYDSKYLTSNVHPTKSGDTIAFNSFDNSSDWIIGAPNLQGQWEVVTTTPPALDQYMGAMASSTVSDGFAAFNAVQYLASSSVNDQNATLELKDTFDFTNYPAVLIEFEQRYRKLNYDSTFIEFSINNGISWPASLSVQLNTQAVTNDPASQGTVGVNVTRYIGGKSDVKMRFRWSSISNSSTDPNAYGSGYGWMVDDLKISVPPENDVQNLSSWIFGELSSGAEYGITPLSQVEQNYYVGASVYNYGSLAQTNVRVDGAFNGPTNFTTTASINSIPIDSAERIESLEPMNFAVGVYNGVITATSSGDTTGSGNFGDNIYLRNFEISNDVYALDGIGNNPSGNEVLSSIGTASFTGGEDGLICATMYPFYANDTINSVKVLINGSESSAGAEVTLRIIDSTSFRNLAFNSAIFSSDAYIITANDIAQEFFEIPVGNISSNDLLFESLPIQAGNYYIAIEMFSFTNSYDIAIMDDKTVGQPAWSSAIYIPVDQQNYTNGNAFAIRVNLGDKTGPNTTGITENINAFSIYPNPTNGILNISSKGNELSELTIKDINGKIVLVKNFQSVISINMDNYGKGVYIVDIKNNLGITSKKISVQ